jgi:hypothetical protein
MFNALSFAAEWTRKIFLPKVALWPSDEPPLGIWRNQILVLLNSFKARHRYPSRELYYFLIMEEARGTSLYNSWARSHCIAAQANFTAVVARVLPNLLGKVREMISWCVSVLWSVSPLTCLRKYALRGNREQYSLLDVNLIYVHQARSTVPFLSAGLCTQHLEPDELEPSQNDAAEPR